MGSTFTKESIELPTEALDFPYSKMFTTPLELLCFYDEDIRLKKIMPNGEPMRVYPWQREILLEFGKARPNQEKLNLMLLAANGSGKSQFVLAPCAVWMSLVFKESLTVITSASGDQIDDQDGRYIARLCHAINSAHKDELGFDVFKVLYREVRNNITKSFIDLFATDEPKKAEGRHPLRPGAEFALIVDEAKTVADNIYQALERCKGNTRRMEISSADDCKGYFYNTWGNEKIKAYRKKITAFDCPHITKQEIQETIDKYGLDSPFVRASIYSEFSSVQESSVIDREVLQRSLRLAYKPCSFGPLVAGLDLAAGGDECIMSVWNGNQEVAMHKFPKDKYTPNTVKLIIEAIQSYGSRLTAECINADDGGVGRGMIDQLYEKGYKVNRVLNNSRAWDYTHYANRGTELWFTFKRFIEENLVHFLKDSTGSMDEVLFGQLCHRYVTKQSNTQLPRLESKEQAKANGHPSPDRADAVVLAWAGRVYPLPELVGATSASKQLLTPLEMSQRIQNIFVDAREKEAINRLNHIETKNKNVVDGVRYKNINRFSYSYKNIFPGKSSHPMNKYGGRSRN